MSAKNVLGAEIEQCGCRPITGFFRDGYCNTDDRDHGTHTVCSVVTEEFLEFTKTQGNDLSTPVPQFSFPGLRPGDHWCLCALRWKQAFDNGVAPKVVLERTHEKTLNFIDLNDLKSHALSDV